MKIATASTASVTSETIVSANHLKKRRTRRESRAASSFASVAGSVPGCRVSQRIRTPARRKNHHASPSGQSVARDEQDRPGDGEEAEPDQRPGPVAPVAERRRGDRVVLPLVGDHEPRGEVDEDAGPAEQGEDDEADAEDRGVDLEVASQAPADAGKHAIRAAALQRSDLRDM